MRGKSKINHEKNHQRGRREARHITSNDAYERWYVKQMENPVTKFPEFRYVPPVTWIAGHYPKRLAFYKWFVRLG
jgi:hypothetical protein